MTDEFSVRSQKLLRWCLMDSQPTFMVLTYLKIMNYGHIIKAYKPDNFEFHNSLKLSFTNI